MLAAACGAGGVLVAGPVAGTACGALAPWALARVAAARAARVRRELADAAPAVARAVASGLAAGRSVRGALAGAATAGGFGAAADAELRAAAGALELGAPTDAVLERLRRRARSAAWDAIVAAVLLQRDAGGDLAGLLGAIAADLEAARRAAADARTATAQARTTARIVGVLPVGALLVGELAAPGTVAAMAGAPLSLLLLVAAAGLEALGVVLIRRIARLGELP